MRLGLTPEGTVDPRLFVDGLEAVLRRQMGLSPFVSAACPATATFNLDRPSRKRCSVPGCWDVQCSEVMMENRTDDDEIEYWLTSFNNLVQIHGLVEATPRFRAWQPALADDVIFEYKRRVGEPFAVQHGLVDPNLKRWYVPLKEVNSPRWAYARTKLGLDDAALKTTSRVADELLARLANPKGTEIQTRGLVVGHVQSGKTTNFLSVAAKALDCGYDLVIILSGVHNTLRRQTQNRSTRTLVHRPQLWWLGTSDRDFSGDPNLMSSHLAGNGKRGLLVVKKNARILKKLADWLEAEQDAELRGRAILVIDDEADQAGLDVAPGGKLQGVHKQLSRIVNLRTTKDERRCAYLAYTATPYANILTSQAEYGLYPKDFIYPLQPPTSYIGIDQLFGDDQVGDPIQIDHDEDSEDVLTEGLRDAIRWFVLATAARAGLGRPLGAFHSSMLIHTTQSIEEQKAYRPAVEEYLERLEAEFIMNPAKMKQFYLETLAQVPSREDNGEGFLGERTATWDEVRPFVVPVIRRLVERTPVGEVFREDGKSLLAKSGVIVDNSGVDPIDRLTYPESADDESGITVIAIGGNTLSRGLTLEGLVCSYFARTSRTYDSLMQMGRWFGYRPGYRHLLRIWTTEQLYDWFRELNRVEQDLRKELEWMQDNDVAPSEYGPRIRVSPYMNVCRAAAMKSVRAEVSYSDYAIDVAWLNLEPAALHANQAAARSLAAGLAVTGVDGGLLAHGVPLSRVRSFLSDFKLHAMETRLDKPSLFRYFDEEADNLAVWNVLFKSNNIRPSTFDFQAGVGEVNTVRRSLKQHTSGEIGSVRDSKDHRRDLDGSPVPDGIRYRASSECPLVVIYAIDPTSQPANHEAGRVALNAHTTPITLALFLPKSETYVQYVAPVVTDIDRSAAHLDLGDYEDE